MQRIKEWEVRKAWCLLCERGRAFDPSRFVFTQLEVTPGVGSAFKDESDRERSDLTLFIEAVIKTAILVLLQGNESVRRRGRGQ